jgi:hypothetical protein
MKPEYNRFTSCFFMYTICKVSYHNVSSGNKKAHFLSELKQQNQ